MQARPPIEVGYAILPAMFDPYESLDRDEVKIHEETTGADIERRAASPVFDGELHMARTLSRVRIKRSRMLGQEIYEALKGSIISGDLRPNHRLIEETLATEIGASRTPVREAMLRLVSEDLVSKLPRGGYIVKPFTTQDIEEVFGILSALECHAAHLTTIRLTDRVMWRLEKAADRFEEAQKNKETAKLSGLDADYHDIIYKASGSKRLYDLIHHFRGYFFRYRKILLDLPDMAAIAGREHRVVLEAMRDRDAIAVREMARRHVLRGGSVLLRAIEEGRVEL